MRLLQIWQPAARRPALQTSRLARRSAGARVRSTQGCAREAMTPRSRAGQGLWYVAA